MTRKMLYPVSRKFLDACQFLDLDPARVLRRAGLSPDFLDHETYGVPATTFCALWSAMAEESRSDEGIIALARQLAQQADQAPIIAFSSSRDLRTGFERLALFKPLAAPIAISLTDLPGGSLHLALRSSAPEGQISPFMALFETVFFVELARKATGHRMIPEAVTLRQMPDRPGPYQRFFGCGLRPGAEVALSFAGADGARRLLSENEDLWRGYEPALRQQLKSRMAQMPLSDRVAAVLGDLLPAGKATADDVCASLALSRRSLQRRLQEEGTSFRLLLDQTRERMAKRYLGHEDMSVAEISYLLAYRDPNSFYRAFQGWTGMTPGQARAQLGPSLGR